MKKKSNILLLSKFRNDDKNFDSKYEPKKTHKDRIITIEYAIFEEVTTIGKSPKRKIILLCFT